MRTTAERVAWGLVLVVFALTAAAVTVVAPHDSSLSEVSGGGLLVPAIAFPVLGAFVIRQRGSHVVGWLLIGMAVSLAVEGCAEQWAQAALVDERGSLPLGDFASWVQAWAWIPGWLLATTLLPAVFPEGRPRGPLRLLAWADGLTVAALTLAIAAASWHLRGPLLLTEAESDPRAATLNAITVVGIAATGLLTCVSFGTLAVRLRRSAPDIRRQIAWAAYGGAVAVVIALVGTAFDLSGPFHTLQAGALMAGVGVAMLRYRLYDIDVVINRTLVYGALTGLLASAYLASVLLLQLILSPSSNVSIAASTLAVAALVRPARARIQALVDRRFFRNKYDAQRTLEAFSFRLRDQVSLDALDADLRAVAAETMQPAHVSLWLRPQ
jgi:hypothetical protein